MTSQTHKHLVYLSQVTMPFGKYKGHRLIDLPEPYVVWLYENYLEDDNLRSLIVEFYDIKRNGLEGIIKKAVSTNQ